MLIAKGKSGYISALNAELEDGPFRCPECRLEVILKKGDIYTHHFAHNPGEGCAFGGDWATNQEERPGESELHRLAKKEISEALAGHKEVTNLKLERFLDSVRPDISFYCNGIPVAIEMQVSIIPPDTILRRTIEYTRRGIYILWISPLGEAGVRDGRGYPMRAWERYIHTVYGGTFYYWTEGETLLPVHFQSERTEESSDYVSMGIHIPHVRNLISITALEQVSLPRRFTKETSFRETKLWCTPDVWVDSEGSYMSIVEAKAKHPSLFPDVRTVAPLEDPFHAEDMPSELSLRGFVTEDVPELKDLFSLFYAKYGSSYLKLIWVSIDGTPNKMYFAPDWWQHFRFEYLEADTHKRERLIGMLQEKLSGERPDKYTK